MAYCIYGHAPLNHLGECCNQVNIQNDGPKSGIGVWGSFGDYEKIGNGSTVYENIMVDGYFLYKDSDGDWVVRKNCQCTLSWKS